MKFSARRLLFSPRRSSTANPIDGVIFRRTSCSVRGRVDFDQLPIAPSTYYHHKVLDTNPERRADRYRQDAFLTAETQQVWEENFCIYGARKVWRQLRREGVNVARCTVERLMHRLRIRGVVRGQRPFTTSSDPSQKRAPDLMKRDFTAMRSNQL